MSFHSRLNSLKRLYIRHSSNPRPSSYPYVTGDGFRNIVDHIYDETQKCNPDLISEKEIVFVKSNMLKDFFENVHPNISNRYILISHNSDEIIDERYLKYIDDKIIHWFPHNGLIDHPKLTPIPFGLDNKHLSFLGDTSFLQKMIKMSNKNTKKNRIFYGFSVSTNKTERGPALASLKKAKSSDTTSSFLDAGKYLKKLIEYNFVASPPGNGLDSPRQWQAFYLNIVPILKSNINTEYFVKQGLPILEVGNWDELENLSENDLKDIYDNLIKKQDLSAIWMDYWIKLIKDKQK